MASDDGLILRLPAMEDVPPGADLFLFDPDELEAIVTERVGDSALFASRFRENAARALLLPRRDPGKRTPLWQQRQRAAQLLDVARKYPDFPVLLETARECLAGCVRMFRRWFKCTVRCSLGRCPCWRLRRTILRLCAHSAL